MKKTGNEVNNTNKTIKKSKNKILSNKIKEKSIYINIASSSNNSTRSTNTQTPLFISTSLLSFEYEYIIQKLLKYLKQKLTIIQYEDIKAFINYEINKIISNKTMNNNNNNNSILDKKDSLKTCKSNRNNANNLYLNGKSNNISKKEKSSEKKLKLSYDFSNRLISSPLNNNNQPIRIVLENIKINEKAKSTSKSNYTKDYKDKCSLYSIVKNFHSYSYNNKNKKNNNSLKSREKENKNINSNRTINSKSDNLTINNTNINTINCSSATKGIFNLMNSNNKIRDLNQKPKKFTTIKSTLIHQSHPLLNEKLFSKLTHSSYKLKPSKKNNIVYNTISNISVSKITKSISYKTEPNVSHNINISLTNKSNFKNENNSNSLRINSYRKKVNLNNNNYNSKIFKNSKNNLTIKNQIKYLSPYENNKIKITNISPKHRNKNNNLEIKSIQIPTLKNEEMIKQIKNTIDDNLKVMFNFSYENFLSKESEHESKEISREIEMNISNENI